MSDTSTDKITVSCECGAQLRVGRAAIGKRGRCPKCQRVFVVSDPDATIPIAGEDEFDLLAQAVADQGKAAAIPQPERAAPAMKCPACGAGMAPNAVLCIECGHNVQTGKSAKAASAAKAGGGALKRMASGAGTFLLGCLLSGVGAMFGAAVWCGVAIAFDLQSGIIAWILGLLAGGGMILGYRQKNRRAGFAAAGIALVGIVVAKVLIVVFVISVLITGDTDDVELQKAVLAGAIANKELDERGVWDLQKRDEVWEESYQRATGEVAGMSSSTFERRWREYKEDLEMDNAYADDTGAKRARVARWRANQRAEAEGLSYSSPRREAIYREEFRAVKAHNEDALTAAATEVDAWYTGDRTGDEAYIRTRLIYALTQDEVIKRNEVGDGIWQPTDDEWKSLFDAQAAIVDAMTAEQRLTAWNARDADAELDDKVMTVAEHAASRRRLREGLAANDERWQAFYAESETECRGLSANELDRRIAEIEAWNDGGMWQDAQYVRDLLIDQHTTQAMDAHQEEIGDEDGDWKPSPEQWQRFREEAVALTDTIPPDQRRARLEQMQQEQQQAWSAEREAEETEAAVAAVGMLAMMFAAMFAPMDLLFIGLAVWSAFRLASGGGVE